MNASTKAKCLQKLVASLGFASRQINLELKVRRMMTLKHAGKKNETDRVIRKEEIHHFLPRVLNEI